MLSPWSIAFTRSITLRSAITNASPTRDARMDATGYPVVDPCISFDWLSASLPVEAWQYSRAGASVIVDVHLLADRPGVVLRCRVNMSSRELARLRQHAHRASNHRRSASLIAAMVRLLAVCSSIVGGPDEARRAVIGARPRAHGVSRADTHRWLGVRLLGAEEAPELFHILADICRRAHLSRLPDLCYLPDPTRMNAYALNGPEGSTIILTEGLVRGMTLGEIAAILAHEVAHIRNDDSWTMGWAAALHHAIELTSLTSLAQLRARNGGAAGPSEVLLSAAPTIGRLFCLALSRLRELDADAAALEMTGDPLSLVAALDKLELHHTGFPAISAAASEDGMSFLRSHPLTSERVDTLLSLAY
jgi:heat shock protein HtpX